MGAESKRLYVGNLFPAVTEEDLSKRFSKFGSVSKIELKSKRDIDGEVTDTFAFIDLGTSQEGLARCIASLSGTNWKGRALKLQQAKESFMDRLARERKAREEAAPEEAEEGLLPASLQPLGERRNKRKTFGEETGRDFTEEREDFKGFFGGEKSSGVKYDPMSLFKANVAGESPATAEVAAEPNSANMGEVKDGLVEFGDDEDAKKVLFNTEKMKVNKVYHSSSEDDELKNEDKKVKKKTKSKAPKEDKQSAEFKQKMTERFLQKQKEAEQQKAKVEAHHSQVKAERKAANTYYSDSDEEPEEGADTGPALLDKFESFAGDVWRDSDDDDGPEVADESEEEMQEDVEEEEEDEDEVEDYEDEEKPKAVNHFDFGPNTMVRYDPLSEEQEKFLRVDPEGEGEGEVAEGKAGKAFFSVTTDLKKAFGADKASGSFSFGFGKDSMAEEATKMEEVSEAADNDDWDDDEDVMPRKKKPEDDGASFGLQLRGKGVAGAGEPFFYTAEDPRLQAGLDFFFEHKVDQDKLREQWDKDRPALAEVLRKRARSKAARSRAGEGRQRGRGAKGWRRAGKRRTRD